jgi:hypothetical protein
MDPQPGKLVATWRHSLASRSCPGAVSAPLLPYGQSTRALRGQVLVPSADLSNILSSERVWISCLDRSSHLT